MNAATNAIPKPEVYYEHQKSAFWIPDMRNTWIRVNETSLARHLKKAGFSGKVSGDEFISPLDDAIHEIQTNFNVEYAGALAGYNNGFYQMNGSNILVTESPKLFTPKEGNWPIFEQFMAGLFVDPIVDQRPYFYGWIKCAWSSFKNHRWSAGQVLAMAGPVGCGKSLLQKIITELFGGRCADPYQFMTGQTPFNEDLFRSEHLVFDDSNESVDIRKRRSFGSAIKQAAAHMSQKCHGKNKKALQLDPFWRMTISLNDEPERMLVLPPLDSDIEDKIILLKVKMGCMPMPTATDEEKSSFWNALIAEMPAFLHFIENWQIPADLVNSRFGINRFHHPELVEMLGASSPENQLLELIDSSELFRDSMCGNLKAWEGKAIDLQANLNATWSSTKHVAEKLLADTRNCGSYLGRLKSKHPDRFSYKTVNGYAVWTIQPPKLETITPRPEPIQMETPRFIQTATPPAVSDCWKEHRN